MLLNYGPRFEPIHEQSYGVKMDLLDALDELEIEVENVEFFGLAGELLSSGTRLLGG